MAFYDEFKCSPYLGSQWHGLQYAEQAHQYTQGSQGTPRELPDRLQQTGPPETLIPLYYYCYEQYRDHGYTQSIVDTQPYLLSTCIDV